MGTMTSQDAAAHLVPMGRDPAKIGIGKRRKSIHPTLQDRWLTRWQSFVEKDPIREGKYQVWMLTPVKNFVFAPPRKLEMDWAWPDRKCGVEIHGGQFMSRGGHNSIRGMARDCEKVRIAASIGWYLLPFCTSDVEEEIGFAELAAVLRGR